MSRASSMQVLNQSFNNLNNALIAYKRNQLEQQRLDNYNAQRAVDNAFRQAQANQAQSNADRAYTRQVGLDEQAQGNANRAFNANEAYRQAKMLFDKMQADREFELKKQNSQAANDNAKAQQGLAIAKYTAEQDTTNRKLKLLEDAAKNKKDVTVQDIVNAVNANIMTADQGRAALLSIAKDLPIEQTQTTTDTSKIVDTLKSVQGLESELDGWYWTSGGRKGDEEALSRRIYELSEMIPNKESFKKLWQSGSLSKSAAQQIVKIKGWDK